LASIRQYLIDVGVLALLLTDEVDSCIALCTHSQLSKKLKRLFYVNLQSMQTPLSLTILEIPTL
jgi:hypothetical protein